MRNFQAITFERHGNLRWQRPPNYAFAAHETVVPLVASELPKAIMSLPIAFIEQAAGYAPAAVLSLLPDNDLFVGKNGHWAGDYIPSAFRAYPVRLLNTDDGQQALCNDEGNGRVGDGPEGETFFADDGQPTQALLDILNFLTQSEQSRLATAAACAVLQKHSLICPWPITLKGRTNDHQIAGLFRIDEAALNLLPEEAMLEVRDAGALPIAYCQLLSMQHLPLLGQLIDAHAKAEQAQSVQQLAPGGDLDLEFFNKGGTISFAGVF